MAYIIVGLGNPGSEYEKTRHNTGRMFVEWFGGTHDLEWKVDKKLSAHVAKVKVGTGTKSSVLTLVLPDTFMNNSGVAVSYTQNEKSKIKSENIIVIYDDIDLPLGSLKISFNRSSGGHNGLESIIKKIKTREFVRIRIGISPTTPSGKIRKPKGEEAILKFLLGKFKDDELKELKKISKKVAEIIEMIAIEGKDKAMSVYN